MKPFSCPLCGTNENSPKLFEEHRIGQEKVKLGIVECKNCPLCYVSPRLNANGLKYLYNDGYTDYTVSGAYNTNLEVSKAEYDQFVHYIDKALTSNASVLDVGCGVGFLLSKLKDFRPDLRLYGFEFSNFAAEKAIEKGFSIQCGDFSKYNSVKLEAIDAIVFLYVLEHVLRSNSISQIGKLNT